MVARRPAAAGKTDAPFTSKLAENKNRWKIASEEAVANPGGEFKDLPGGRYKVRLKKAVLGAKDGREYCRWEYQVLEGEYAGQTQSTFDNLVTDENLVHFARKLEFYGYDSADVDLSKLQKFLDDLVEAEVDTITAQFKEWSTDKGSGVNVHLKLINEGDPIADYDMTDKGTEFEPNANTVSWAEMGKSIDAGKDEDGAQEESMKTKAGSMDLDPNDYGPWEDLGTDLDEKEAETAGAGAGDYSGDPTSTSSSEEEPEQLWAEIGAEIDDEKDADGTLEKSMEDAATVHGLDSADFGPWSELGERFDEIEASDREASGGGDAETTGVTTEEPAITAEEVRGYSEDELVAFAKESESELDENDYSWEEYAEELIKEFKLEEGNDPESGDAEVVAGSKVACVYKGKDIQGTVQSIDEVKKTVTVKPDGKGKPFTVGVDSIEILE